MLPAAAACRMKARPACAATVAARVEEATTAAAASKN